MSKSRIPLLSAVALIAGLASTCLLSCSDDACTLNCNGEMRYPLVVGYSWQYDYTMAKVNFRPDNDSTTQRLTDSLMTFVITLTISNVDTLDGSIVAFEFHEVVSKDDSLLSESYSWYANFEDGFYYYPDEGSGPGLRMAVLKPAVSGSAADPTELKSYKILEYPVREGLQWEYTNGYAQAGAIFKTVIGIGEQTVPAGKYECYAVAWLWESVANLKMTSYYADVGLVRSRLESKDLVSSGSEQGGQPAGKYDEISELRLIRSPF